MVFCTEEVVVVTAVTAQQMRQADRIAVEEFGLGILQMMEDAGCSLVVAPLFGRNPWLPLSIDGTTARSGDTICSNTEGGSD